MPPQPLLELYPNGIGWDVSPGALKNRPDHALAATQLIVTWTTIECSLTEIMASLLKGSPRVAMEMMGVLRSFEAQSMAIRRVAQLELPRDHAEVVQAVLRVLRKPAEIRNKFAHHLWGVSRFIIDGLLLADPLLIKEWHVDVLETLSGTPSGQNSDPDVHVEVWSLAALAEAQTMMDHALRLGHGLEQSLSAREAPRAASILETLRQDPEVVKALADIRRRAITA